MTSPNSRAPQLVTEGPEDEISAASILSRKIGATVESDLEITLWRLLGGEIELDDLTPALAAWWTIAFDLGHAAGETNVSARLEWERDLWYFVANNRGKRPADFYVHLTDQLWATANNLTVEAVAA